LEVEEAAADGLDGDKTSAVDGIPPQLPCNVDKEEVFMHQ